MENKETRSRVKFLRTEEEFKKEVGKPEFNSRMLLDDNFNMVCKNKMTLWEDRPVSIAQAILDKSKIIMTKFYYDHIKKVFRNRATMLYGDTDSAYLEVHTDDFFAEIKDYVPELHDTSVYVDEKKRIHPAVKECNFSVGLNKKEAGLIADDSPWDFITEFRGTASREYCYKKEGGEVEIKAKGIEKKTRKQVLSWKDYNNAIFGDGTEKQVEQVQIRSFGLKNHTIKLNKKIFKGDRKRILVDGDKINTLANGHWRDIGDCVSPETFPLPKKGTLGRMCLEILREEYRKKVFA